jgi:predicted DNA-binding transcriptional regulator AlpA
MERDMTETMKNQPLVNEHQAAELLGLKVSTLRRWRWAGTGPSFVKIGAAVRYDPNTLRCYIDDQRRSSTSDVGENRTNANR